MTGNGDRQVQTVSLVLLAQWHVRLCTSLYICVNQSFPSRSPRSGGTPFSLGKKWGNDVPAFPLNLSTGHIIPSILSANMSCAGNDCSSISNTTNLLLNTTMTSDCTSVAVECPLAGQRLANMVSVYTCSNGVWIPIPPRSCIGLYYYYSTALKIRYFRIMNYSCLVKALVF